MRRGYFTDFLDNLVRVGFYKNSQRPKEFYLLQENNDIIKESCNIELTDELIEEIRRVGFKFNEI
jgi:hypothetical protein